ncbi:MAG: hypothetical protein RQ751_04460 [Longimicrobiales bacterium]|nr:hypothetical protein [Longimicrobiales bacterium]
MVLTFLLLGGFMYWLYATAEPTQQTVIEEVEDEGEPDDPSVTVVSAEELKTAPGTYAGQTVRLRGVSISSTMGRQVFFVDLPASADLPSTPFLVRALPEAAAELTPDAEVSLTGVMVPMADSVVTDWLGAGIISENDRLLVEFATHFIEATRVRTGTSGTTAGPAGG